MDKNDLISRAAAISEVEQWAEHGYDVIHWTGIKAMLEFQPAVDAAPGVHGRWIEYPLCLGYAGAYSDDHIVCSNCKSVWSIMDNDTDRFEHCPNCGAKMDGERRDDDAAD